MMTQHDDCLLVDCWNIDPASMITIIIIIV